MNLLSFLILGFIFAMSRRTTQLVMRDINSGAFTHLEFAFIDNPKLLDKLEMNGIISNLYYWGICIWGVFSIENGYIIVPVFAFLIMPFVAAYVLQYIPRILFSFLSIPGYIILIFFLGNNFM
jgi:hypothetical protein